MSRKPELGRISSDDHEVIDNIVHNMIYASAKTYTQRSDLRQLCARIGFSAFDDYMERNWDPVVDMWVMYLRASLPHFRNHTNNRLENFFGKLKKAVCGTSSMTECVAAIVASERRSENESQFEKHRIGRYVNTNYDEEMNNVLLCTTHFVDDHVAREYKIALEKFSVYKIERNDDLAIVSGKYVTHTVNTITWACDCTFAMSMKLPCRHAMVVRKATKHPGSLIPLKRIDTRYHVSHPRIARGSST